jgi:hypothetical protein
MEPTDAVIAMMGMLVSFALPLLLVIVILFYKHRRLRVTHETIARLAERGVPIPPELLDPPRPSNAGLRGGLVLVALGIALAISLNQLGAPWSLAFIPGLMGVALLIAWRIEKKQR